MKVDVDLTAGTRWYLTSRTIRTSHAKTGRIGQRQSRDLDDCCSPVGQRHGLRDARRADGLRGDYETRWRHLEAMATYGIPPGREELRRQSRRAPDTFTSSEWACIRATLVS